MICLPKRKGSGMEEERRQVQLKGAKQNVVDLKILQEKEETIIDCVIPV